MRLLLINNATSFSLFDHPGSVIAQTEGSRIRAGKTKLSRIKI